MKLQVELDDSAKAETGAVRPLWPTEEGCAAPSDVQKAAASTASSTAQAAASSSRTSSGTTSATKVEEQPVSSAESEQPIVPVAVLLAFHLTYPSASRPSLALVSSTIAEEWTELFRQAHPTTPAPAVLVLALTSVTEVVGVSSASLPTGPTSEHHEATMSQQPAVYTVQLLLVANTTATDEKARHVAAAALMEQMTQLFGLVAQRQLASPLLASMDGGGPFAQCDVSHAYLTQPADAITCDEPSLQASINNLTVMAAPQPDPAPSPALASTGTSPAAIASMHHMDMSSSMSTEAQIGLAVASVLFFLIVYRALFYKRAEGLDEVDRMGRQRPVPVVRHAVDEQQHINDELYTPASSSSSFSSSSSTSSSLSTASEPRTRLPPASSASSFFSLGWLPGRADKVWFSPLEQQDRDEQEDGLVQHGEADERRRVEQGVGGGAEAEEGEGAYDSHAGVAGVEVAVTYR